MESGSSQSSLSQFPKVSSDTILWRLMAAKAFSPSNNSKVINLMIQVNLIINVNLDEEYFSCHSCETLVWEKVCQLQ